MTNRHGTPFDRAFAQARFARAHDRELSLWQSAAAETVRRALGPDATPSEVLEHPLMVAVNEHVQTVVTHGDAAVQPGDPLQTAAFLSKLYLAASNRAVAAGSNEVALDDDDRPYADDDYVGIASCVTTYLEYWDKSGGVTKYNSWEKEGNNDLDYGVIEWPLPNDAVVAIIGDWGTGLGDASALLKDIVQNHKPTAIIHLGDIYWSGTESDCTTHFSDVLTAVFDEVNNGQRIPVFTLAGNHDYYAWGGDFYAMFNGLNGYLQAAVQSASYFCLRTEDKGWQFLAMDSGYGDSSPFDQVDKFSTGPDLRRDEVIWLQDKLTNFAGATVLLSHHQLFSANSNINGTWSGQPVWKNQHLLAMAKGFFGTTIAAWLWGHEHNFALFKAGILGLAKGRLLGNSAWEQYTSEDPYAINNPQVQYLDPTKYRVDAAGGYYNHSYAVIKLANRQTPTSPIEAEYYQYPSWYPTAPPSPASSFLYTESYELPAPRP